jgi:transposase
MPAVPGVPAATPGPSAEQAEIRRLQKELERAQMERDILKKTIGIFSGPPK